MGTKPERPAGQWSLDLDNPLCGHSEFIYEHHSRNFDLSRRLSLRSNFQWGGRFFSGTEYFR